MAVSIVLGGLKHCGKTTHGRRLADRLGLTFIDADDEILKNPRAAGCGTCRDLCRKIGETGFRQLEAETLAHLAETPHAGRVLALGGGAAGNPFVDPAVWKKLGFLIYLDLEPEAAYRRIEAAGLPPFLAETPDPHAAFLARHREQDRFWRQHADRIVKIAAEDSVETVSEKLENLVRNAVPAAEREERR